jgi:outer membrane lipoprotein SlyB
MALLGCAAQPEAQYRPIVDMKGRDVAQYEQSLRDCQSYSAQAAGAGEQATASAAGSAIFGALLAVAAGGGYSRNRSTLVGGLLGGVSGAAKGETHQRNVIRICLANRGYSVLQ